MIVGESITFHTLLPQLAINQEQCVKIQDSLEKGMEFCLVSDVKLHINAHFIGKKSKKGRDFTWVQSIGVMFGPHQLYIGANQVAKWKESMDNMLVQLDQEEITVPNDKGRTWEFPKVGLRLKRLSETNKIQIKVDEIFDIVASVVPITL
ncbi:late embryogenesis abundant protein-related/LEA protein-related [Forsythia ovata]|uniref:Late embryogenesis abundant protein-related/LEA protein-related n=1 Tax=Forsythia ovata TaxID=205694 RepID=A0ABD1TBS2_9LAMI